MDEKQPAERDDAFYYTRWYYWKSKQAPLSGSEEGAELESTFDRVSPASITSLYLQTHHHGCNYLTTRKSVLRKNTTSSTVL